MEVVTQYLSLSVEQAEERISSSVLGGSVTGQLLDRHEMTAPDGKSCVVLVYEKHFLRAGNRLTLTVTLDDFTGRTRLHCVGGGGGQGLFRFDWGAGGSFSLAAVNAVRDFWMEE